MGKRQKLAHADGPGGSVSSAPAHQQTAPGDGAGGEDDPLHALPQELLMLVINNLTPRERQPLRLASKYLCGMTNKTAECLTVHNDLTQFILHSERELSAPKAALGQPGGIGAMGYFGQQPFHHSSNWVEALMLKFPNIRCLDIKCSQQTLTTFSRHLVRDVQKPGSRLDRNLVQTLAENVRTNSRRHSAVLLCELLKSRISDLSVRGNTTNFIDPKATGDPQARIWRECIDLVDAVLALKGSTDAKNHENFKYARDTLDDTLLELCCCLQAKHSKLSYALLSKAADPAKAARGWRWLFYCLAQQRQAEAAIEAYKVVDKATLNQLSPTCLSELFRSLIENEIATQPEAKLRAITSETGSWTKFLYRGTTSLTAVQSREGALEKICCDLICKGFYNTCLNVINRFETDTTALEVWQQLMGAHGMAGGCLPLRQWSSHDYMSKVDKILELVEQVHPNRRNACYKEVMETLVCEGMLEPALEVLSKSLVGGLDRFLWDAVTHVYVLHETPANLLSGATLELLMHIAEAIKDAGVKAEVAAVMVSIHAAKGNLQEAVQLAQASPQAFNEDGIPLDEAAAAALAHPHAPGNAAGGSQLPPVPIHSRMWHHIAAAAAKRGDLEALVASLPHLAARWVWSGANLAAVAGSEVLDTSPLLTPASESQPSVWQQIVTAMVQLPGGEAQLPEALDVVLSLGLTSGAGGVAALHANHHYNSFEVSAYHRDVVRATAKALLATERVPLALVLARRLEAQPQQAGHMLAPVLPVLLSGRPAQHDEAVSQAVWLGEKGGLLPPDTATPIIDTLLAAGRLSDAVLVSRTTEQEDEALMLVDEALDTSLMRLCEALLGKGMVADCLAVARRITSNTRCCAQMLTIMRSALAAQPEPDLPLALSAAIGCPELPDGQQEVALAEAFRDVARLCLAKGMIHESLTMLRRVHEHNAGHVPGELWAELVRGAAAAGHWDVARSALASVRDDHCACRDELVRLVDSARPGSGGGGGGGSSDSRASSREPEAGAEGVEALAGAGEEAEGGVVMANAPGGMAMVGMAGAAGAGGGGAAGAAPGNLALVNGPNGVPMEVMIDDLVNAGLVLVGVDNEMVLVPLE